VIASNYGRPHLPAWYHNLVANPEASLGVDGETRPVRASRAEGDDAARLWKEGLTIYPGWAHYRERASHRDVPIMVLTPRPE
jgi:deazaflavin-dependent oxidoreductase (nitroreductase family)